MSTGSYKDVFINHIHVVYPSGELLWLALNVRHSSQLVHKPVADYKKANELLLNMTNKTNDINAGR